MAVSVSASSSAVVSASVPVSLAAPVSVSACASASASASASSSAHVSLSLSSSPACSCPSGLIFTFSHSMSVHHNIIGKSFPSMLSKSGSPSSSGELRTRRFTEALRFQKPWHREHLANCGTDHKSRREAKATDFVCGWKGLCTQTHKHTDTQTHTTSNKYDINIVCKVCMSKDNWFPTTNYLNGKGLPQGLIKTNIHKWSQCACNRSQCSWNCHQ